jgi:TPR repeat protein
MAEINSDADVDTLIWSTLQGSTCAQDYLDFIRHASGRAAPYEEAFLMAEQFWHPVDHAEQVQLFPSKFPEIVAEVQAQADGGNPVAMLHLGQFFTKGIGMKTDEATGQAWLRRGADLGNGECMILLGHSLRKTDWTAAREVLEHAVSLGHDFAHLELAEIDPQRRLFHLEQALKSENPYVYALYGEHLVKQSQTEQEKAQYVQWVRRAATEGDTYGCLLLSSWYGSGNAGCAKDPEVANYWLRKGSELGSASCYSMLGHHGFYAEDGKLDFLNDLRRASMLGDTWSQSLLGWHGVWRGQTVQAQEEGVFWLRTAARLGYKSAMFRLSEALRAGRGTEVDNAQAINWLEQGAELGHSDCQSALGHALLRGEIAEQNLERAHDLFQIASLQGNAWATYLLGATYENGDGVARDLKMALKYFKEASELGDTWATYKVGAAYYYGLGVEESNPSAVTWFRRASAMGSSEAKAQLGIMLVYGHGVERNIEHALKWLNDAAAKDNSTALRELALLHESGTGMSQDLEECTRLMAKAAALGDRMAHDWMTKNCPEKPAWLQDLMAGESQEGGRPEGAPTDSPNDVGPGQI